MLSLRGLSRGHIFPPLHSCIQMCWKSMTKHCRDRYRTGGRRNTDKGKYWVLQRWIPNRQESLKWVKATLSWYSRKSVCHHPVQVLLRGKKYLGTFPRGREVIWDEIGNQCNNGHKRWWRRDQWLRVLECRGDVKTSVKTDNTARTRKETRFRLRSFVASTY